MNRALISITRWYYILARYAVTAFGQNGRYSCAILRNASAEIMQEL